MRFLVTLRAECEEETTAQDVKEAIERALEDQERLDPNGKAIKFHKVRATPCE